MLIKRLLGLLVIICTVSLIGCSRLEFYTDPKLEGPEVGVKFYYTKPYLLVTRTSTTLPDKTQQDSVQVSVISLPDLSQPIFAKMKSGFGSANLSLAFQDGRLTSVGQQTDTKIPETITAIASLATAAKPTFMPEKGAEFTLYEINVENGTMVFKKVMFPIN